MPEINQVRKSAKSAKIRRTTERNILLLGGIYHHILAPKREQITGTGQSICRPKPGLSRRCRTSEPCCAAESTGARDRRAWHRQGADCRAPASPFVALGRTPGDDELRGAPRKSDRSGIVRP